MVGEEEMKTTLGQKSPHDDDNVFSPALDKDTDVVDDEEREVVDQPEKEPIHIPSILILRST